MIAEEPLAEVQDTVSAPEQVEARPTWRDALLARLHPADHHITDEQIFAVLNDQAAGTAAELCETIGVTVPMYCVWKSKYRQMDLDQLRQTRRREQRRRYTVIGVTLLASTLSLAAAAVGLSWALLSALSGSPAVASAPSAAAAQSVRVTARHEAPTTPPTTVATSNSNRRPAAEAPVAETGYRIQITAAETEQQGRATVTRLASAGYPAYMTHAVVDNKNVFRVRVGPFETLPEAEEIASQLKSAGYAGVWIAR